MQLTHEPLLIVNRSYAIDFDAVNRVLNWSFDKRFIEQKKYGQSIRFDIKFLNGSILEYINNTTKNIRQIRTLITHCKIINR